MTSNEYHFITYWRMRASAQEVIDILSDAEDLPRWWPSVYLRVTQLEPGDKDGIGKKVELYTKGWLPYTLRWEFSITESNKPHCFTLQARGDFVGRGIWTFQQDGEWVNIAYDWKISAEKPLLRRLSFVLKPVFAMNHHWAMTKGEESLRLELLRRHAVDLNQRNSIPEPPAPTPTHLLRWASYVIRHRQHKMGGAHGVETL